MTTQATSRPAYLQASQQAWTTQTAQRPEPSDISCSDQLTRSESRYTILKTLHDDTHARIYQVRDAVLGRILALKQIDLAVPGRAAYFRRMKACAALNHANIARIYDLDEQQAQVAMEFVDGWNLRAVLRVKRSLSLDVALYVAIQLVNGLRHAHAHKVVHHALMPEHVLLTRRGGVKIIAFRTFGASSRKHQPEHDHRTVYLPPEWFTCKKLTTASNVYSFGVIVYEMLSGARPFAPEQLMAACDGYRTLVLDEAMLPPGLCPILQQCVEVDMTRRESDIRAIGAQLIDWYTQCQPCKSEQEHLKAYQDFLLMAWADGKISAEEATFLEQKRAELGISELAAQTAEHAVKQELAQVFCHN